MADQNRPSGPGLGSCCSVDVGVATSCIVVLEKKQGRIHDSDDFFILS